MENYSDIYYQYEMAGGFSYHSQVEAVLANLGFKNEDFDKLVETLSSGQKSRLMLAKLLLSNLDVLLLDEPTNHLDINAVEWLEDFLTKYPSTFLIISHDRFLLNRVTNKTVEVENGCANVYPGNYTAYLKQREKKQLSHTREYEKQQELISKTEDFIRRKIAGSNSNQAKSRRKMLEKLERIEKVPVEKNLSNIKINNVVRTGDNVLAVSKLSVGYGTTKLAGNINLLLHRGDRLGIVGANGTGKTTFLKTITSKISPLEGKFSWGANTQIAYFDQELSSLDDNSLVINEMFLTASNATEKQLRSHLAKFLFTGDDVFKPVAALSGGERSRLALAKLVYSCANVLVLDEPTNHLDVPSREALEKALIDYDGTIITVSHDRYFLDQIATQILHFDQGVVNYCSGGYSYYWETYAHTMQNRSKEKQASLTKVKKF